MVQKNMTAVHAEAYHSERLTLSKRDVNQFDPDVATEESNSWWNRLLGCEKVASFNCLRKLSRLKTVKPSNKCICLSKTKPTSPENESLSCNGSEIECAARRQHHFFQWWECWRRFCVFPERQRLQEHGSSTSHRDRVEVCESLPVKKKVLQVSLQEDNRTTSTSCHTELPPKESDWGPTQNTAIVQSLSGENRPLEDIIEDDITPVNNNKWRWWRKRGQVAPNPKEQCHPKQSLNSSHQEKPVVLGGLEERKTSWKMRRKKYNQTVQATSITPTLRLQQLKYLGLPNPAQICYMNASLQSLLTLEDFVEGINCQKPVWSLSPEAALIRSFMNISACHSSRNIELKIRCLYAFKNTVSLLAPEFQDLCQKVTTFRSGYGFCFVLYSISSSAHAFLQDAHEFLTSVLDQIRNLKLAQQKLATKMGKAYYCPVEEHFVFKMQNIRMCLRCNMTFSKEEEFTNLSLDLLPGCGTVEEMLQNYLKKTQVEFQCECGSNTSLQNASFISLPR
ncbi:ubiquitin carboxyl-terminal hydrolase 37-like isoform X2 [Hippocampus comes]|uniref:ubiquitin carboxyl-terminal hydrolase 37-like isoform X2 n=1 Tax=Hippocampus comes TaxID=109280 RepID=UPI00094F2734|nr:PREDICTED: ubiquitin carboxyl-terminal hydrolase 37-like isoform X2 [Hippocampus comes]